MAEDKRYEINEEDIGVALRYLKYHDPKNATREKAVALLSDLDSGFHRMAHEDPERLLNLKKRVDKPQ
jgi:hypothetical protein